KKQRANRLGRLAFVFGELGQLQEAEHYFRESIVNQRDFGDVSAEVHLRVELVWTLILGGRFSEAVEVGRAGLRLAREKGEELGEGRLLARLALAYRALKDP